MISGGYNNNSNNNRNRSSSSIPSKIRKVGNSLKKSGKRALNRFGKSVSKKGKKAKKIVALILFVVFFFIIFVSSCTFLFSGEDDGKSQNYIDYENYTSQDGEINLSPANASVKAYYTLVSKNRSVWQEKVNENGEKELILSSDNKAVKDYFKNDKKYYIQPDLLFVMNEMIFGEDFVYPEAFLKPVNYNKDTYTLESLVDENGNVCVTSKAPNSDKEISSVADYGLGTVMTYHKETKTEYEKRVVYKEDVYNEATGMVETVELTEPRVTTHPISSTEYDVLDKVITFCSEETYSYSYTDYRTGELSVDLDENADNTNPYKRLKETKVVNVYVAMANYSSSVPPKYFSSLESAEEFCASNNYYLLTDGEGNPIVSSESFELYEYLSDDSGKYTSFVTCNGSEKVELGYDYYNSYLYNFSTYKPNIERTYDTFRKFSSSPSINNLSYAISSNNDYSLGEGETAFERHYNGSNREVIEKIYDALILWGYSEEQACAVLGNVVIESQFSTTATNSESGAYGLAQWTNLRLSRLESFARSYNGADKSDLNSQIQFLCMELDANNLYSYTTSDQWSVRPTYKTIWNTSSNVDELTEAMAIGWERYATPDELASSIDYQNILKERQANSRVAYELMSGRTPENSIEIISPFSSNSNGDSVSSSTVTASYKMNEEDSKEFNQFYYAVDKIDEETIDYTYYQKPIGREDVEYIFAQTNTFINGTLHSEEEHKSFEELTENGYFTNLDQSTKRRLIGNNGAKAEAIMENGQMRVGEDGGFAHSHFWVDEWCAMFVWSLFYEADMLYAIGDSDGNQAVDGNGSGYASAHTYLTWGLMSPNERIVYYVEYGNEGYADGQYGDIVVFDYEPNGTANHIGLILTNDGNGFYTTLEGNYGDRVAIVQRQVSSTQIFGIIRPAYNIEPELITEEQQEQGETTETSQN